MKYTKEYIKIPKYILMFGIVWNDVTDKWWSY